jgi:hypothetical protein
MLVYVFEGCKKKNLIKPKNIHLHKFPKKMLAIKQGSIQDVNFDKGK